MAVAGPATKGLSSCSRVEIQMETAYYYVGLSVVLSVLLWIPYILARMVVWGIATLLNNYAAGFPVKQPEQALWAVR
jgi:hypothetical protein